MDYGLMPPEINSARMYSGPGSDSLLAAAAAWERIADGLDEAAAGFGSVTARLNGGWQGTAVIAMTQAAAPYLGWLNAAALKGQQAAAHAKAAANAYEEAHGAMVPPAVIAANRSRRTSLAGSNQLSQDAQAIALMDAHYEQMWAQDVEAMYSYADASAAASRVTPFTSGPLAIDLPALAQISAMGDPEVISVGSQLISTLPQVLQALASSPLSAFDVALASVSSSLARLSSLAAPVKFPMHLLNFLGKGSGLLGVTAAGRKAAGAGNVQARWGGGMNIGRLSVPPAWGRMEPPSPFKADLQLSVRRTRLVGGRAVNGRLVYA
jgi:PPE-repeat protein